MAIKKIIIIIIISILAALAVGGNVTAIVIHNKNNNLHSELSLKDAEIEKLQQKYDSLKENLNYRVEVENDYWDHIYTDIEYEGLHGTIIFNDTTYIDSIGVSYKDEMLCNVKTYDDIISFAEDNKITTRCYYNSSDLPVFCVLDITYTDGRAETIVIRIAMG